MMPIMSPLLLTIPFEGTNSAALFVNGVMVVRVSVKPVALSTTTSLTTPLHIFLPIWCFELSVLFFSVL